MIPRTFPSTYASNGQQQMVVYFLPSITGLQRWLDYIPVKLSQGGVENSYNNNGYIDVTVVSRPTAAQQAWKEYIPAYLDDAATDAWRVNATGYIPYGYALFGGASMIMDMTNTGALDPRITFSRASNATLVNSAGAVAYAPHNLLTFSESFDNAAWNKTSVTVTANTTVAPDGTTTADTITFAAAGGDQRATQGGVVPSGASCTFSVWLKGTAGQTVNIELDTTAVTVTLTNAFVRYSVTGPSAATTAVCRVISRSGNTATVLDVWGAQLNVGALQPYYPTTVKNLLGFTQEFNNAAWTKTNSTITANATAAPDGSVTADKLVENTATSSHFCFQAITNTNVTLTNSVYAKAGERSYLRMQLSNFATGAAQAVFNLVNGTIHVAAVNGGDFTGASASIVSVGNGWYRCSLTAIKGAVNTTIGAVYSLDNGATNIYTGDGTSGIFIWGAQLSDSASLDPYVYNPVAAPTAAAYYGPRFDYDPATLAARGLLIEEQRTQLLLWSEDFTQASWSKSNVTATGNTAVAPSGLTTADTLAATANNGTVTQGVTTTAVAFTFSVYLKRKTGTGNVDISMDGTTWVTQTINSTTWTRCIVTQTGVAGTSNPGIRLAVSGDEVYAWGAQAE